MQDLNETCSMVAGRTTYQTMKSVFRLDNLRATQHGRAKDKISFGPGPNKYAIDVLTPLRFQRQLLSNNGDGTRGRRQAVKYVDVDMYP